MTISIRRLPQRLEGVMRACRVIALLLAAVGVTVLIGTFLSFQPMRTILPWESPVQSSTAINLILSGLSIFLLSTGKKKHEMIGRVLATVLIVATAMSFAETVFGQDFGINLNIPALDPGSRGINYPEGMAPLVSVVFLLVGCALVFCDAHLRTLYLNELFAGAAMLISLTTLIGNACGANQLCTPQGCIKTTFFNSAAYLLVTVSVCLLRPVRGAVGFILAPNVAGVMMRRLALVIMIIPALLWLRALGVTNNLWLPDLGWAIFGVCTLAIFVVVFASSARVLQRIDEDRARKHDQLVTTAREKDQLSQRISQEEDNQKRRLKNVCLNCSDEYGLETTVCPKCGDPLARINKKHFIGEVFDKRYEIKAFLGAGGMSNVYEAEHKYVKKQVALKVIHAKHAADPVSVKRLQQEARSAGALTHDNLVSVYDFGITEDGEAYLIMEFVKGQSLAEVLAAARQLTVAEAMPVFIEIASALEFVHHNGIMHRDLKPSNVMLMKDENGRHVKIVDFGLARDLNPSESAKLTTTGEVLGSPAYLSPEQCEGKSPDQRSDVYALGCLMYECLAGRPPFVASNAIALLKMHLDDDPAPFDEALKIPKWLSDLIFKSLAKKPEDRYQSMREIVITLNGHVNQNA